MSLQEIFDRLGTGERWWAAEFAVRAMGLVLLAAGALATLWLDGSVHRPPPHEANALELITAVAIVLGGCGGGMLTFVGPALFKQVPVPGRSISHLSIGDSSHG